MIAELGSSSGSVGESGDPSEGQTSYQEGVNRNRFFGEQTRQIEIERHRVRSEEKLLWREL